MKSPRRILDTSMLIGHWQRSLRREPKDLTSERVRVWARQIASLHGTRSIVTPVRLEFIAGVRSSSELDFARSFLSEFEIADDGKILEQDWRHAENLAARVPQSGKPRQLGDCLIRAIAHRLRCEVRTADKSFPRP